MWKYSTSDKNTIDVTEQIDDDYSDGSFIDPNTGILTLYNEGGHNSTTCNIRKLFEVIKNNPKLYHLLSNDTSSVKDNKCSNCKYWTNEADPCEWWSGKFAADWKDAKFCLKSDFDNDDNTNKNTTAWAISKEGYIAGLMTKPDHSCNMFEPQIIESKEPTPGEPT